jgi:mannosyltransferase OCH1-like enzyme
MEERSPLIVHVTSMSRCNHPLIADNLETWKLKNNSFFLHDNEATEKLIYKDWPEFPQLQHILKCLPGRGAVWADVWRILVLWEYGGIYADIDTSPVAEFFNETTLSPRHDAFFCG